MKNDLAALWSDFGESPIGGLYTVGYADTGFWKSLEHEVQEQLRLFLIEWPCEDEMIEVGRKMRKGEDKEVLKTGMDLYFTLVILVEDYCLAMNQYQSDIPERSEIFALWSLRGGRSLDDVSAEERRSFQEQDSLGRHS